MIEQDHKTISNGLLKISVGKSINWFENLSAILWIDRSNLQT